MVSDAFHAAVKRLASHSRPVLTRKVHIMQPFITTVPTLAVSVIYCLWQAYARDQQRRRTLLHERVAFMLWTAAMQTT